ncbi:MAG: VWA domain-containing protein [Clostridia bacterium]|nr:VWA domain-containing protein [Clostridia bacterium]
MSDVELQDVFHTFILVDVSPGMADKPLAQVNALVPEILDRLCRLGQECDFMPLVHILSFSDHVTWLYGTTATHGVDANRIVWSNIHASGHGQHLSGALEALLEGLSRRHLGHRSPIPYVLLLTDGPGNDAPASQAAFGQLMKKCKTFRIAVCPDSVAPEELSGFVSIRHAQARSAPGDIAGITAQPMLFRLGQTGPLLEVLDDVRQCFRRPSIPLPFAEPSDGDDDASIVIGNSPEWI